MSASRHGRSAVSPSTSGPPGRTIRGTAYRRLTITSTVVRANAICPKASAVPRLIAPSAPAIRLAAQKAPNMISRSVRTARIVLERRDQRRDVQRRVLLGQPPLGGTPPAERAQTTLAVLGHVVAERMHPPGAQAALMQVQ